MSLIMSVISQITELPVTATPTVGTPYCQSEGGTNYLRVSVKNNDSSTVTIKSYSKTLGTLAAGATATFNVESAFPTPTVKNPYYYSISITAQAIGKEVSTSVSDSGAIYVCTVTYNLNSILEGENVESDQILADEEVNE